MMMMMKKKFEFVVVVIMLLLSVYLVNASAAGPPNTASANHLLMVVHWGKAYCKSSKGKRCQSNFDPNMPNRFLTHGCWPKPDTVCLGQLVNQKDLETFYNTESTRLDENWPDANAIGLPPFTKDVHTKNVKFWSYQWNKHGICQTLLQGPYFISVLDRYDDLTKIHDGIVQKFRPTGSGSDIVKVADVIRHVKNNHHVDIQISCTRDLISSKFMLFELYFNLTLNGVLQNMTTATGIHNDPCPSSSSSDIVLFV